MAVPRRETNPKRKANLNQEPYGGGEDPNYAWTAESQDEMSQHYAKEHKKEK